MKNKLKLLLFGMIGLLTLSTVPTYAITFKGNINTEKIISGYNGFSFGDYDGGFYGCIYENYKSSANLKRESAGCSDGYYAIYSFYSSYGALVINRTPRSSYGRYKLYAKKESSDIFSLPKYRNGDEMVYKKNTMKNLQSKMLNVKSLRGENVYDEAFVDGIGFVALVKDENQVRAAHIIANSYILDGYLLAISQYDSYIIDTYSNKIYKYNNNFYSIEMQKDGVAQIFPKLWNTVPDEISDVVRGAPMGNNIIVNGQEIFFSIENTQTGTKATLAELRDNIKKSITILDQEGAEFFLGETPESYGIGTGQPNTQNQLNTSGSNTSNQLHNSGAEEKKACVDYYTKMKSFTAISVGCRGESREGEEKYEYWENILFGMYEQYNTWDKVRYWNCYNFGIIKEKWIKSFGKERFDAFQRDWETKYLYSKSEDVDINAMCSHIVVKEESKFDMSFEGVRDYLNGFGGVPIYNSGDFKLFRYDYRADTERLKSYRDECFNVGFIESALLTSGQLDATTSHYCDKYYKLKFEILEKYKNADLGSGQKLEEYISSIEAGSSQTDYGIFSKFLKELKEPYYSGYMSVDFVAPVCGAYKSSFFEIFVYLFFFGGILYFLKIFS